MNDLLGSNVNETILIILEDSMALRETVDEIRLKSFEKMRESHTSRPFEVRKKKIS